MDITDIVGIAGVPVIVALVALWKMWSGDARTYPIMALALGLIINILAAWATASSITTGVLLGVTAGLVAAGLYSGQKALRGL